MTQLIISTEFLPYMLNQIIFQSVMCLPIPKLFSISHISGQVSNPFGRECRRLTIIFHGLSICGHIVKKFSRIIIMEVSVLVVFNNHILQDGTSNHNSYHIIFVPNKTWVSNKGKTSLQNSECSFNIFFDKLLILGEQLGFLQCGKRNWLDKLIQPMKDLCYL